MPRVLILSAGDGHASLSAARSLSRAGHVVGLGGSRGGPWASRFVSWRHEVPAPERGRDDFLTAIGRAVAERGYDVVFGSGDDWMAALALWGENLDAVVGHPGPDAVLTSLDKAAVTNLARDAGLRVPRTAAGAIAPDDWPHGAVVKTRRHWLPDRVDTGGRLEAVIAADAGEVERRVSIITAAGGEAVVQELITGRLMSLVTFAVDGRLALRLQQVASGTWPTPAGVTARAETVPVDELLADGVERLLGSLHWSGIMQVEFVLPDDGPPVLIDLNGRFYGSMALAVAAGIDLPVAALDLALHGTTPVRRDAPAGVRYQWLEGDLRRAALERRGGAIADFVETLRFSRGACGPVLAPTDPGPALARARKMVAVAARRGGRG